MGRLRALRDLFPWTSAGLVILVASGLGLVLYGSGHRDLVLGTVGATGLLISGVALVGVLLGTAWVWWRQRPVRGDKLELETGRARATDFSMLLPPMPFIQVQWQWVGPPGEVEITGGLLRKGERVTVARRALAREVIRRVEVRDAFGLCSITIRCRESRELLVRPATGRLETMEVSLSMRSGDSTPHPEGGPYGDLVDMRSYGAGDPIRYVLWKVFARTRELVVRTPENAISPVRDLVAYLVAGPDDGAAAAAARVAVKTGALGGTWTLGADGVSHRARDATSAEAVILASGSVEASQGGAGLGPFLHGVCREGARLAMVFVPPRPGPWLQRTVDALTHTPIPVDVVVALDGIERRKHAWWEAADQSRPPATPTPEELAAVLKALSRVARRIHVADRTKGTIHPAEHLRLSA